MSRTSSRLSQAVKAALCTADSEAASEVHEAITEYINLYHLTVTSTIPPLLRELMHAILDGSDHANYPTERS